MRHVLIHRTRKTGSTFPNLVNIEKPFAERQAGPEAPCEGLDPVMPQHHRLGHTQVELLLGAQSHTVSLGD